MNFLCHMDICITIITFFENIISFKLNYIQDSTTEIALLYYVALEEGSSATFIPEYDSSGNTPTYRTSLIVWCFILCKI
jgi:hypothetical protein